MHSSESPPRGLGLGTVFFHQAFIFHTLPPEDQYFGVSHMESLVPADACFAHTTEAKTRCGLSRAMTHDFQFSNHMEDQRTRRKRALQRRRVVHEGFLVWFAKDEHPKWAFHGRCHSINHARRSMCGFHEVLHNLRNFLCIVPRVAARFQAVE